MAAINDLINQIEDEELKTRIENELDKFGKQKKYGLVYENHLPECTPLYDVPVKKGCKVALKTGKVNDFYEVIQVIADKVICLSKNGKTTEEYNKNDLVVVAEFGDPIYPYLQPIDSICNAPDSNLWHTLIQADNYHALQLLEYLYAEKVDCIYIDPPYNTGASDWKYNNDYIDKSDIYRHSKWLSMIEKRLRLAKKLLDPNDSVLIVTIDEKEYLHLGCLLEELFPEATIQMITSIINPKGRATDYFTRTDEYIFYVFLGKSTVVPIEKESGTVEVRWPYLKRSDTDSTRGHRPRQFYPIYVNDETGKIVEIGDPISIEIDRNSIPSKEGCTTVFPVNEDGTEMEWGLTVGPLKQLNEQGYVRVGKKREDNPMPYSFSYLSTADVSRVEQGVLKVIGEREDGTKIVVSENGKQTRMQTVWSSGLYDAGAYGKTIIGNIIPDHLFSYPKSLYAVHDTLKYVIENKPEALIIDFFAGSGTTMHAVNLLNAEDLGKRRCILVTNNEVSADEADILHEKGINPGDEEWENLGIAKYITWPRTRCSIIGRNINNEPISGNYITTKNIISTKQRKLKQFAITFPPDKKGNKIKKQILSINENRKFEFIDNSDGIILCALSEDQKVAVLFDIEFIDSFIELLADSYEVVYVFTEEKKEFDNVKNKVLELSEIKICEPLLIPMSEGFKANAAFFKLSFLDKTSIELGRQFREMLPTLWLKAGSKGPCPSLDSSSDIPKMLIYPENRMAILIDENFFSDFEQQMKNYPDIQTVYLITDFEKGFKSMKKALKREYTYQLYRDYLDNFRINTERK